MNITVIGGGRLGLATATIIAQGEHNVVCADRNVDRVRRVERGILPLRREAENESVRQAISAGRLRLSYDVVAAVADADAIFLAMDEPRNPDGSFDSRELYIVVDMVMYRLRPDALLVNRCCVPDGTSRNIATRVDRMTWRTFDVVDNPLVSVTNRQQDGLFEPTQIVINCRYEQTAARLQRIYEHLQASFVVCCSQAAPPEAIRASTAIATVATRAAMVRQIQDMVCTGRIDTRSGVWGLPPRGVRPEQAMLGGFVVTPVTN